MGNGRTIDLSLSICRVQVGLLVRVQCGSHLRDEGGRPQVNLIICHSVLFINTMSSPLMVRLSLCAVMNTMMTPCEKTANYNFATTSLPLTRSHSHPSFLSVLKQLKVGWNSLENEPQTCSGQKHSTFSCLCVCVVSLSLSPYEQMPMTLREPSEK